MGVWIFGKIRYMFWSLIVSAVIMVATSFSPKSQQKIMQMLNALNKAAQSNAPQSLVDQLPDAIKQSPNLVPVAAETVGHRQVSSSSNEYVVDDANYVLIKGKYYKASADNKYRIDGKLVYYVNNRRQSDKQKQEEFEQQRRALDSVEESSLATSPDEMMDTLTKAQKSAHERNRALKELEMGQ